MNFYQKFRECVTLDQMFALDVPRQLQRKIPDPDPVPDPDPDPDPAAGLIRPMGTRVPVSPTPYEIFTATVICYFKWTELNLRPLFYGLGVPSTNNLLSRTVGTATDIVTDIGVYPRIVEMRFLDAVKSAPDHTPSLKKPFRNNITAKLQLSEGKTVCVKIFSNAVLHMIGVKSKKQYRKIVEYFGSKITDLSKRMQMFNKVVRELKIRQVRKTNAQADIQRVLVTPDTQYEWMDVWGRVMSLLDYRDIIKMTRVHPIFQKIVNTTSFWILKCQMELGYRIDYDDKRQEYRVIYSRSPGKKIIYGKKRWFKDPRKYYKKYFTQEKFRPFDYLPVSSSGDALDYDVEDRVQSGMVKAKFNTNFPISKKTMLKIMRLNYKILAIPNHQHSGVKIKHTLDGSKVSITTFGTGMVHISAPNFASLSKTYDWICGILKTNFDRLNKY